MRRPPPFLLLLVAWTQACGFFVGGCSPRPERPRDFTPAEQIWFKAEYRDRTNDPPTAYFLLGEARRELLLLRDRGATDLNYDYCLGMLAARLSVLARALGDTNAAEGYLEEAQYYLNAVGISAGLPVTNYSPETIEDMVRYRDAFLDSKP